MRIFLANIDFLEYGGQFERFLPFVCGERREKACACASAKKRAQSLGAGLLLNYAVARVFPDAEQPVRLVQNANGKPFVAGEPSIFVNLSHSGSFALCGIGASPVGVDIEKKSSASDGLLRKCCTAAEYERLAACGGPARAELFRRIWTRKESYIKATGEGLAVDLSQIDVLRSDGIVYKNGEPTQFFCRSYEQIPGYAVSVCSTARDFPAAVEAATK